MRASGISTIEIEEHSQLDDKSLRQRWRRLMSRPLPDGLGRVLIVRLLAYQQQAQLYGDLDAISRRALADALASNAPADAAGVGSSSTSAPKAFHASLRPGTLLTREYGGVVHRVMVMERSFCWNGRTYDSLSKVAFAIIGTRWNGPRFFGLRDHLDFKKHSDKQGGNARGRSAMNRSLAAVSMQGAPP